MNSALLVGFLALGFSILFWWGFKNLPGERWQMLASVPVAKNGGGSWRGINITYYGLLVANANALALLLMLFMMGSTGVGLADSLFFLLPLLSLCAPAARLMAWLVEKKRHTFTIGGASFVAFLLAPLLAWLTMTALGPSSSLALMPTLAALTVSYAVGEGLGRLACISFGCCYGMPLSRCSPWLRRLFLGHGLIFSGPCKKVSYEGRLEGEPLAPVQAITAVLYTSAGLAGLWLFLEGCFHAALLAPLVVTQGWRALSELMRADFRGQAKFTAYQKMALAALVYGGLLTLAHWFWAPGPPLAPPILERGLDSLWKAEVVLVVQGVWLAILLYLGRSKVTRSTISFEVVRDRL